MHQVQLWFHTKNVLHDVVLQGLVVVVHIEAVLVIGEWSDELSRGRGRRR